MLKKFLLLNLYLFSCFIAVFSQKDDFFIGFKDTNRISQTFSFKFVNNLVIIPMKINGSDTLYFILDTGIKPTLLTNFNGEIEFQVAKQSSIRGLGEGEDLKVWETYENEITMGDITLSHQNVYVLEHDRFNLSEKMGMEINGIIGSSIFENFVVEIDFEKKNITFYNPKKFKYKKKHEKWLQIPLTIYKGKPYTKIKVSINQDTTIFADVLIDLGASDALWLFSNSNDSIPNFKNEISYFLGEGLNGDIFGYQKRVNSVNFGGNVILQNVTVSYPDSAGLRVPSDYDIPGRNGSIGSEILRRFTVIFDYQNTKMLLKKNTYFKENFNYDLSGLEIKAPYIVLPFYVVFYVQKNSPAEVAGFQIGDQILKVDGVNSEHLKLNDILLLLRSKEGKKIKILVQRDEIKIKLVLTLKNYR